MGNPNYRKLEVWKRSHQLAVEVYRVTERFPPSEQYRLTHQLCRAEVSVPANIAEAEGRYSRADQIHFLHIARGSLFETQYLVALSAELGLIPKGVASGMEERYSETARLLNGLIRKKRGAA